MENLVDTQANLEPGQQAFQIAESNSDERRLHTRLLFAASVLGSIGSEYTYSGLF
jgi:hypothetical protein